VHHSNKIPHRVGYGTYFAKNAAFAWRFPLALSCLFPLILILGSPWVPESPRWRTSPHTFSI
jgi:hypothetical protein